MKNVHIILTDKPSRLFYNVGGALLFTSYENNNGVNIYITSNEEIKEGYWHFKNDKMVTKSHIIDDTCKKIILTTDQDLIKDGVQAIDDDFLEWFVKNPSCEEVEVVKYDGYLHFKYIIIPKEEPKQHLIDMMKRDEELGLYEEPKQETISLEEAAEKYNDDFQIKGGSKAPHIKNVHIMNHFIEGANWQQEQILQFLYSEITERRPYSSSRMCEEVIKFIEQFKKK